MRVDSIDHLVLTVADIAATCRFYAGVLGMEMLEFPVADGTTRLALKFGSQKINLHQLGAEFDPKAQHPVAGSADLCFLTKTNITDWVCQLNDQGIPIEQGPVKRTGATGVIRSIYLRDPDGNLIEISELV
ncbi:MAG: VOC family protein [Rhodobacteraceae bacterium]|nr:VOC family protein [Paracoccaceae bacterium]